jgi:hypothetical protein
MLLTTILALSALASQATLPVRGLHFAAPSPKDVDICAKFIREVLPREGVNTLVIEFDYKYKFQSHPEVADADALANEDVEKLVGACKDAKVRLIPEMDLLGHQSWAGFTFGLLRSHPEFDETPGKFPGNKDIYCRSYCPNNPNLHKLLFDLIDELSDACHADAFHVGMDEIFILADKDCPFCKGQTPEQTFTGEVNRLHDHLSAKHLQMWMWGDRFLNGRETGLGEWEASANHTEGAVEHVPHDIVICDWHYDHPEPTAAYFAACGFPVVTSSFKDGISAVKQLRMIIEGRANGNSQMADKFMGMLHTTWVGFGPFVRAYYGQAGVSGEARDTAKCFKDLFAAIRSGQ